VVQIPPWSFSASTLPYIITMTAVLQGENNFPLLQTEQRLYVSDDKPENQILDTGLDSQIQVRRQFMERGTGSGFVARIFEGSNIVLTTKLVLLPVYHRFYADRKFKTSLRDANFGSFISMEISPSKTPSGGFCSFSWDPTVLIEQTNELSGIFGARYECSGWIGGNADAYPLSYNFGLTYR